MVATADDDAALVRQRDEAVDACREMIRGHLSDHLIRNPDATFVSWIAALHPENVEMDARLRTENRSSANKA